jgi:N-acetylglucosaminyldiphosphoundecaprenol N-acetyl-beta-D-mannosaminyltransferase
LTAKERVLGIDFFNGSSQAACDLAERGGLVLAPSGPGLAGDLTKSATYREAVQKADLVLADSGLLCLWAKYLSGKKIQRVSGLLFLQNLLEREKWVDAASLWVMPDQKQADANMKWMSETYTADFSKCEVYISPMYPASGLIIDQDLLQKIEQVRPKYVFIQIGGGTQERLGLYLKQNLSFPAVILCTGAALAFLSGQQVKIPRWADYFFLGWLMRCLYNPSVFIPRYLKAFKLIYLLFKYGEKSPVSELSLPPAK